MFKWILKWLAAEYLARTGIPFNVREWSKVDMSKLDLLQQPNLYDCGVYSLMYAECVIKGEPLSSVTQSVMLFWRIRIASYICNFISSVKK